MGERVSDADLGAFIPMFIEATDAKLDGDGPLAKTGALLIELQERRAADPAVAMLVELAQAYEDWERALLMENWSWQASDSLPRPTQTMWDRWIEIQAMRNEALAAYKEATDEQQN